MNITETPIWDEIQHIRLTGPKPVHFEYKCEILIVKTNEVITPLALLQMDVERDYHNNLGDVVKIKVKLGKGTHDSKLYPNKENFIVTIKKYPLAEVAVEETTEPYQTSVYRGVLVDDTSGAIAGDTPLSDEPDDLDNHAQEDYEIQLIDRAIEQLRYIGVSGIYHNVTTGNCLRGLLTIACSRVEGVSVDEEMLGVDLVSPSNTEVRDHCVIPHGVTAMGLPDYMQEEEGGIYSFGIGTYIQNKIWYIYPEYHLKRFSEERRTLTILNVPAKQLPGIERTFFTDGSKVIVIATGETIHSDESEAMQMNHGNGIRFANGSSLIPYSKAPLDYDIPFRNITPEGRSYLPTASREDNTTEFIFAPRSDGLNLSSISPRRITDNPYFEESQVCRRFGGHVFATWENSDPDLLYPGMPARYLYMEDGELKQLNGILMGNDYMVAKQGSSITDTRYVALSQIHLFVESIPK